MRSSDTDLAEAVRSAARTGQRLVVRHNGDTAAVVSVADLQALEEYERLEDEYDIAKARDALASEPAIPFEQVCSELGL
jgi:hypothetical protein